MTIKQFNEWYTKRYNAAVSFVGCIDNALKKSPPEAGRQFRCIGWTSETAQTLNEGLIALREIRMQDCKEDATIWAIAHTMCRMPGKPSSCDQCPGKSEGCLSLDGARALYAAGYRQIESSKKDGNSYVEYIQRGTKNKRRFENGVNDSYFFKEVSAMIQNASDCDAEITAVVYKGMQMNWRYLTENVIDYYKDDGEEYWQENLPRRKEN